MKTPNFYLTIIIAASPLGWFGGHHFYVGNRTRGVVYLVFSLTLIPAFLAVIESFILMHRGRESFIEKHGTEEDLDEYHLEQLRKNNPLLAQRIMEEMESEDNEDEDSRFENIDISEIRQ